LTPGPAAGGQKPVETLLVDFVHVQQAICCSPVECTILDVLADDAGSLLVAAPEEPTAIMAASCRPAFGVLIMLMCHGHSRLCRLRCVVQSAANLQQTPLRL
jgi:hypothetical protein